MSRSDQERFTDIIDAVKRCEQYAPHLNSQDHSAMAYDAILRNLAVIGEAVRALSSQTRARNRGRSMGCHRRPTQRAAIAGLRNVVVHEYFRINPELIPDIVENQLTPLKDQLRGNDATHS